MWRLSFGLTVLLWVLLPPLAHSRLSFSGDLQKPMVMEDLASQPLAFTENRGQWDEKALFKAEAGGADFWLCRDEVVYQFIRNTDQLEEPPYPEIREIQSKFDRPRFKKEQMVIRAKFIGADPHVDIVGESRLPHNCNYFLGNDPGKWATDVPNYSSVIYQGIYPGIDLKYHGNGTGLKYDFIVNPGADISWIGIKYDGAENLSIASHGELEAVTSFGPIHENIPAIYQPIDGHKIRVEGRYILRAEGIYGFEIDDYNPNYPLVIDPALIYSTYLGGNSYDCGHDIALDGSGCAYVTGFTYSVNFPSVNPYDGSLDGSYDAFVSKLSPAGNSLIYSTYLGGNDRDEGRGVAIDVSGSAYVTGLTYSNDFPTQNPYQTYHGNIDAFITKLSPSGNSLVYSTYLGGSAEDDGLDIALGNDNCAYLTGKTYSTNFPVQNPYQTTYHGGVDAFVTKLSSAGNSLVYSTYLGGSLEDDGNGITVDGSGHAYVAGGTWSANFPIQNPFQVDQGSVDGFVTMFAAAGNSLIFSTYLGGTDWDECYAIALDLFRRANVTGRTSSTDFPTLHPYQTDQPFGDAFVAQLSAAGNTLVYSTYLGGDGGEEGYGITMDAYNCAYIVGWTNSTNFPIRFPYQTAQGNDDVFVAKLSQGGDTLAYGTYLGGCWDERGHGIATDGPQCAYLTGWTSSYDFPTVNPYDSTMNGFQDAFVSKFGASGPSGCSYTPGDINGNGQANGIDVTYGVSYLKGGSAPPDSCDCPPQVFPFYAAMDVNGNCAANGIDITYFVSYLKGQQPALLYCADCPPAGMVSPPAPAVMPIYNPSIKERGNLRPSN